MTEALMSTYARLPVTLERGAGARVWDDNGREYLDALAGIAVCGLGHAHPDVTAAVADQAGKLVHCSNNYRIPAQEALGERLAALAGHERAFFCNSGAEANETALKIARRYGHERGVDEPTVIVCERAFHGRTLATLTATGNRKIQAGFEPLVQGFVRVPFDDLEAVERVAGNRGNVVAVLVEPVQGEGGIRVPSDDYLPGLRRICDQHGWLLMLDEIQTGVGRTGAWFAQQHAGITADVTTVAKALANGVPIGACVARGHAAEVLVPGSHGTTFGGNPLACRAGLAVLERIERDGLVERAGVLGNRIRDGFRERLGNHPGVRDIRGRGLMIGIELAHDCGELTRRALDAGLLINVTAGRVIRLLPPLVIDDAQADAIVDGVSGVVETFLAEREAVSA
ncbi:MAG: aspartate aminotransferase family protein [Halofilum sp. (in: g-proteobacteria)]|nr:aspartate aminotransferase family protein [Halofilum sp. (in: g-proteobacteria)]